jgi:lipopolysaccharide/colanic/teichoic acid biosynthesis glycosyltransferase
MLTPEQLEEYRREYKLEDDPRLIGYKKPGDGSKCFGAFIRRTSIDELPQILFNICLRGNMSVVGPRPILRDELTENYTPAEQRALLSVKPGLTGYWQAYARNNATYESGERQHMELYYVKNASFLMDLKIIFATVGSVLKGSGAK